MIISLSDGRAELYQWDTGRELTIDGAADATMVHFATRAYGRTVDVEIKDGKAKIPDFLLQTPTPLSVYLFAGTADAGYTKIEKVYEVKRRNKPADYVFTPTEQKTLEYAVKVAEAAEAVAASVRADAEAGKFKGDKGDPGAKGDKGADGAPGKDGANGAPGAKGDKGEKGDAFTYADFTAAQIDALKVKGDKGDKGDPGAPGEKGAQGIQGEKGVDGAPGAPGADGHTPVITATKTGKVTTIKSDGKEIATVNDGADGLPGADGAPGAKGDQGKQGIPGKDGENGLPGEKGDKGDKGDPGSDYVLTDADKSEIAALVLAQIPDGDEVAYG